MVPIEVEAEDTFIGGHNDQGQQGQGDNLYGDQHQGQHNARGHHGRENYQNQEQRLGSCNYYGISGHWAKKCCKNQNDIRSGKLSQNNYPSTDYEGSSRYDLNYLL